jgi:predicted PurR-regulated permease PerM
LGSVRTPDLDDLRATTDDQPEAAWRRSVAITASGFALAIVVVAAIWLLARPLTLVLVAIIIAQALMPIVGWMERWLPRVLSVVVVFAVLFGVIAGLGWLIVPTLLREAKVLVDEAPATLTKARELLRDVDAASVDQVMSSARSIASRFGDVVLQLPLTIFSSTIDMILVVFMSAYWLIEAPDLKRFTLSLFPEQNRERAAGVMDAVGSTMGGFVRGTVIDSVIIAGLTWVGLTVLDVRYPLVLAVVQGIGELVPVVGPIIAAIPALLVAFAHSPEQALLTLIFFIVLQQVESNLLLPLIMRHQADVPPLVSLVAVLVGSALGGLLGGIIAIPLAGAFRILIVRVLAPAEREWTGVDDAPTEIGAPQEQPASG